MGHIQGTRACRRYVIVLLVRCVVVAAVVVFVVVAVVVTVVMTIAFRSTSRSPCLGLFEHVEKQQTGLVRI